MANTVVTGLNGSNPISRKAVRSSLMKGNNYFAGKVAEASDNVYATSPVPGQSKRVQFDSPASMNVVATKGSPSTGATMPLMRAHPREYKIELDATHLWTSAADDQDVLKALMFNQGNYYKNKANPSLAGISEDVKIRLEGSEDLYKDSFLERFCGQTMFAKGFKIVLAESRRTADSNFVGLNSQFDKAIQTCYANEKEIDYSYIELHPTADPYKGTNTLGYVPLLGNQQIIGRHDSWLPEIYKGQKMIIYLDVYAIHFGS